MAPPFVLSDLNRPELEALRVNLFGEVAVLKQTISEQREEITRLVGLKGRSSIRPSKPNGMDSATEPTKPAKQEKRPVPGQGDVAGHYRGPGC